MISATCQFDHLLIIGENPSRQNQEGVSRKGVVWGDVFGGDFVSRGPSPFLQKVIKLSCG